MASDYKSPIKQDCSNLSLYASSLPSCLLNQLRTSQAYLWGEFDNSENDPTWAPNTRRAERARGNRTRNAQLMNMCCPGPAYTDSSGAACICGLEKKVKIQMGLKAETRCDWRATENITPWETDKAQSGLLLKKGKKIKNIKKAAWEVIWSQCISVSLQRKYKVLECSWMQRQKQWWGSEPGQLCIGNEAQGFSALSMTNPCNTD